MNEQKPKDIVDLFLKGLGIDEPAIIASIARNMRHHGTAVTRHTVSETGELSIEIVENEDFYASPNESKLSEGNTKP